MAKTGSGGVTNGGGPNGADATTPEPMRMPPRLRSSFKTSARSIARENLSVITTRGTRKSRQILIEDGPLGNGMPVILVPGFLTGDWSMRLMATTLKTWGFAPFRSGISLNVGCTNELVDRLVERVRVISLRRQSPVAIVGWSRGGTLAKLVALQVPDEVSGIVTLVSPNANPLAVSNVVVRQLRVLNRLNAMGAKGVMGEDCIHGECAASVEEQLGHDFPADVPYVSMYTRSDGVVDWRACLDPEAQLVEVEGTHLGVGNDVRVIRRIAGELVNFAGVDSGAAHRA